MTRCTEYRFQVHVSIYNNDSCSPPITTCTCRWLMSQFLRKHPSRGSFTRRRISITSLDRISIQDGKSLNSFISRLLFHVSSIVWIQSFVECVTFIGILVELQETTWRCQCLEWVFDEISMHAHSIQHMTFHWNWFGYSGKLNFV